MSVWYRVGIVASVLWIICLVAASWDSGLGGSRFNLNSFLLVGLAPLVVLWGVWWIITGRKK